MLKPALELSRVFEPDGGRRLKAGPSIRASWYPGLPLFADAEAAWMWELDDSLSGGWTVPVSVSLASVPLPWLTVSAGFDGIFSGNGLDSLLAEAEIEPSRGLASGTRLRFPVGLSARWAPSGGWNVGASVSVGWSSY